MKLKLKNEILVIGDSLTSDIKGGNNCGIRIKIKLMSVMRDNEVMEWL